MRGEVGFPNRQAGEAIRRPDDQRRYRPCRTARQPCAAFPIAGNAQRCTPGLATELELPRPPLHKPKSPGSPSRPAGGELPWPKRDHSAQTRCRHAVPRAKSPRETAWCGQHPDPIDSGGWHGTNTDVEGFLTPLGEESSWNNRHGSSWAAVAPPERLLQACSAWDWPPSR